MKLRISDVLRIICALLLGSALSFVGAFIGSGAFVGVLRALGVQAEPVILGAFVAIIVGWVIGSGIAASCIQGMSRKLFLWIAAIIAVVLAFPIASFFTIGCGMDGDSCAGEGVGSVFILFPGLPLAAFVAYAWIRQLEKVMKLKR